MNYYEQRELLRISDDVLEHDSGYDGCDGLYVSPGSNKEEALANLAELEVEVARLRDVIEQMHWHVWGEPVTEPVEQDDPWSFWLESVVEVRTCECGEQSKKTTGITRRCLEESRGFDTHPLEAGWVRHWVRRCERPRGHDAGHFSEHVKQQPWRDESPHDMSERDLNSLIAIQQKINRMNTPRST